MLIGKTSCGKTTVIQALRQQSLKYKKTQAIDFIGDFIDTPGEYLEIPRYYNALLVTSYECDIVCFAQDAASAGTVFPPQFSNAFNRPVVGIVTKLDHPKADIKKAEDFLKLAGARRIFNVSAFDSTGMDELRDYLQKSRYLNS